MSRCKICRAEFVKRSIAHKVCGPECAEAFAAVERERKARTSLREARIRAKSRSKWLAEAQAAFNAYVRARDSLAGYGCISCGTRNGKMNAGHYRSVGACPELRFEESQVHLQCERCNSTLSANLIPYRQELLRRVGTEKLAWIEGPHQPKRYTISDAQQIKKTYKQKLRELDNAEQKRIKGNCAEC